MPNPFTCGDLDFAVSHNFFLEEVHSLEIHPNESPIFKWEMLVEHSKIIPNS